MKTNQVPKTVQRWIDANQAIIDEILVEDDCFGDEHEGPWSIWLYLKAGYINRGAETHHVHECTARDFLAAVKYIDKCDCDQCKLEG